MDIEVVVKREGVDRREEKTRKEMRQSDIKEIHMSGYQL